MQISQASLGRVFRTVLRTVQTCLSCSNSKPLSRKGETALRRQQSHSVELPIPRCGRKGRQLLLEGGAVASVSAVTGTEAQAPARLQVPGLQTLHATHRPLPGTPRHTHTLAALLC